MQLVWIGNEAVVNLEAIEYVHFETTECRILFRSGEKVTLNDQNFRDFVAFMSENFKIAAKSRRRVGVSMNAPSGD
jgi:hypothetical protein